jgi:hypothetical protein
VSGPQPSRNRDAVQRVWSAIRVQRRELDIPTLAMLARAPETSTGDYVRLLVRSGYLIVVRHGQGKSGSRTVYQLARDTGPLAPRRCITVMQDANTLATFDLPLRRVVRRRVNLVPLAEYRSAA